MTDRALFRPRGLATSTAYALALVLGGLAWAAAPWLPSAGCVAPAAPAVDWQGCRLATLQAVSADLRGVRLARADLPNARLRDADLSAGDLRQVDLSGADLRAVRLAAADLTGADLRAADLRGAVLRDADLTGADLRGARVEGLDLRGAALGGARWVDGRYCAAGAVGGCEQDAITVSARGGPGSRNPGPSVQADTTARLSAL